MIFEALKKAIENNEDPTEELAALVSSLGTAAEASGGVLSRNLTAALDALGKKMDETSERAGELRGNLQSLEDPARNAINAIALPSIGAPITSGAGVFNPSQTQLEMAEDAQRAAVQAQREAEREAKRAEREATQEANRAAKEAAQKAEEARRKLNNAIASQTSVAVDAAAKLLGKSETINRSEINSFLKAGGVDLDAATTAWCAAFVNSALAQVGVKGSGSNVATSFANWGNAVNLAEIQRGDVLVQSRGAAPGETGGHVGFATGNLRATADGIKQIELLSGNASNKVTTEWVDASSVIARRAGDAFQIPAEALKHLGDTSTIAVDKVTEAAIRLQDATKSAMKGLISDLLQGKDAGEALAGALSKVADQLLDMALDSLFSGFGGGGGGGLLGGFLIPGILHGGGVAGKDGYVHGRAVSPSTFAGAKRYHTGGVAGLMPGEVPAILQRGEVVLPRGTKAGGGQQVHVTVGVSADNNGNLMPFVQEVSQKTVNTAAPKILSAANQQAPAAVSKYQASKGGAEWR